MSVKLVLLCLGIAPLLLALVVLEVQTQQQVVEAAASHQV
jgi:hypothetical protein